MISFKVMWEDVKELISKGGELEIDIIEKYNTGFTVKEKDNITFITKDDFVDLWCKMLYYNEVPINLEDNTNPKERYLYNILRKLPYIDDNSGILKIIK
ncbi:hypothetical protein HAHI6034_04920 [Hathewaya histolytica]|uniref:Uncharacterized protein n=1 Tax=Hathewaya histolytica TaxID=1498 RepID=A0A4U9RA70_HATHI|nr:hypothetical protein [Hathewaya histolytica]VTQ87093.1 Uncharacterised protein [Hathewaya histolytica]